MTFKPVIHSAIQDQNLLNASLIKIDFAIPVPGANSIYTLSAQTAKNIFDPGTPVTYLGIDFTLARVIGESADATDIRDRQFPAINNVVIAQSGQFDIAGALQRSTISSDLTLVNARNGKIPVQQIKSGNGKDFNHLAVSDIDKLIGSLRFLGKEMALVLLFVVRRNE